MFLIEYLKKNFKPYTWIDSQQILEKNFNTKYPETKKLILVVGANGAGKSTLIANLYDLKKFNLPYVNADMIEKKSQTTSPDSSYNAMLKTNKLIEKLLQNNKSFVYETVFSQPDKLQLIEKAFKSGYDVIIFYVFTNNVEINIERVAKRVSEGGHNVPIEKIISRYPKVEDNAKQLIGMCHRFYMFDNSNTFVFNKNTETTKNTSKEM